MRRIAITSAALAAVALSLLVATPANSQQALITLCTSVFSRPSNSFTSLERLQWAKSATDAMCQTGFNNVQSFRDTAVGLKPSIPVASGLFGLGASGSLTDTQIQQAYNNVCVNRTSVDTGNDVTFIQSEQISSEMTTAFQNCVKALPEIARAISPTGVILTVRQSGADVFEIFIDSYTPNPIGAVTNMTGIKKCTIEGKPFRIGTPVNLTPAKRQFTGTCERRSADDQSISVSTDQGVSNIVALPIVPSPITELQKRTSSIQQDIGTIRTQLGQLSNRQANMSTDLILLRHKLQKPSNNAAFEGLKHWQFLPEITACAGSPVSL